MSSTSINRFDWLKAVIQSDALNPAAKTVATALAVQYANADTGKLNPSISTLAAYVKASPDTVKRAVRALVKLKWLGRTEGRGRGNSTSYTLLSPGKIVTLSTRNPRFKSTEEKGGNAALLSEEKGADLRGKGGNDAPSRIEQSYEQKNAQDGRWSAFRFDGAPFAGPSLVAISDYSTLNPWTSWLKENGFPPLCEIGVLRSGKKTSGDRFAIPRRSIPQTKKQAEEAIAYFNAVIETEGARYAAQ